MNSKTKTHQKSLSVPYSTIATSIGAWIMAIATLIGMTEIGHNPVAVLNTQPSYTPAGHSLDLWTRKDSENETVHMATKYDVGLKIPGIAGRR
jgi:hypothetical protein